VLERSGILLDQRLELIDGELINKMGKNRPHVIHLNRLAAWLRRQFGEEFVNQAAPTDVAPEDNPTNEPEPDIIVLRRPESEIRRGNPQPQDVALAVEVSDSTLAFDRSAKARLYARAGIAEYWVLDINGRRMLVHRDPQGGAYQSVVAYGETEKISPLAAPSAELLVGEVLL
jgi:Uma2 family endonuclease